MHACMHDYYQQKSENQLKLTILKREEVVINKPMMLTTMRLTD